MGQIDIIELKLRATATTYEFMTHPIGQTDQFVTIVTCERLLRRPDPSLRWQVTNPRRTIRPVPRPPLPPRRCRPRRPQTEPIFRVGGGGRDSEPPR